jgi:TetR/AcrR family transcriptional regulator, regulator of autoinduction and epiphytic fitness
MTEDVKPRRRYESPRRQEQAAQTRRDILAAAGSLFRERGYTGTSMPQIAAEAAVVVETVYRAFGSKAGLFREVIESALAGGPTRADAPVEERPAIRALIEEPDPRRQVALYAATQPGIHRRAGPLLRALRDAAGTDKELRKLWDEMEAWRLDGQGRMAGMLAERGALRRGLSVEDARDVVWTLCSLAVHDLLVLERGWSYEHYEAWLAAALVCELLPDA